jgi:hypothetical protein
MSDKESILRLSAAWARKEKDVDPKGGKILVLNKSRMDKSLLEDVGRLYSDVSAGTLHASNLLTCPQYNNIQFIRVPEPVTLGKKEGMAVLVALYTDKSCTVGGRTVNFGDEHTIRPGDKSVEVHPAGEFLYAEKGATDTM